MGRVIINRRTTARALRTVLDLADRLHRGALLVLVLVLVGLAYAAAPFLVALFTAIVTAVKAAVFLAGAATLARLAVKAAAEFRRPASPAAPTTTPTA
ncbi:hypothetical protein QQY66_49100 [Streptomyces sp. DG2A-72]|uniref:hypothetical protein n=1 Tax=Streptomyces sp. DG2A-72 TaxID=3051386 RepID=UPI00265C27C6|nr:hypothetical protein [Streptomyces sp. DG2A-72]MDO0939272.1 hypothetical protein [Streptomyces sp. DG2A-72]